MRQTYSKGSGYSLITNGTGDSTTIQNISPEILIAVKDTNVAPITDEGFIIERHGILRVDSAKYVFVKNLEDFDIELEVV